MMNKYLVVIAGPTGVGKTDLVIRLALHYNSVIISADSRQIYKELNIGTAVPSSGILEKVKHYFIGNMSIHEYYNASKYEYEVLELLTSLYQHHDIIFMTGGSGMYINAVCKGIDDLPEVDQETRQILFKKYKEEGIESLRMMLKRRDPEYYAKVDLKNYKRILKALEICIQTGTPYSSLLTRKKKERDFRIIKIGLNRDRNELYALINQRTLQMIEKGLIEEAKACLPFRNSNALNTVGYKEIFEYLNGTIDLKTAVYLIQRNTRKYARKQLTWFRKDKEISWFHPDNDQAIITYINQTIKELESAND